MSLPAQAQFPFEAGSVRLLVKPKLLRNQLGSLCVSLFSSPEGFPSSGERALYSGCYKIEELNENPEIVINNLNTGSYAIALFHDENSDGQLNTGVFGIPMEGFGFSNNPKIKFSAPKYAECQIQLSDAQSTQSIELRYFL
jgi:uncharacterized protein (DUF2141 family)